MKKILAFSLAALMACSAPANIASAAPDTKTSTASVEMKAAKATAISSAEDLKAMEKNPSGSYYLAKDITLPADFSLFKDREHPFKGQLDGKGHKLIGYTYKSSVWSETVGIFGYASKAVFKNLSVTGVNIDINKVGGQVGTLVFSAKNCTFDQIKTSGKIQVKGISTSIGGIINMAENAVIKNCTSDINITVDVKGTYEDTPYCNVAGIVRMEGGETKKAVLQNCTNKGSIQVNYKISDEWGGEGFSVAGIVNSYHGKNPIKNCKNIGAITCTVADAEEAYDTVANVSGVIGESLGGVDSCSNAGRITVTCKPDNMGGVNVAGVVLNEKKLTKSFNTGKITVTTNAPQSAVVGGVAAVGYEIYQCYNKGMVAVSDKSDGGATVGGVAGSSVEAVQNCYNTGAVSISAKGASFIGGLVGFASVDNAFIRYNYSTGKVTGSGPSRQISKGQLLGFYEGSFNTQKRNVMDNYYTRAGKAYGAQNISWKPYMATSKKVSSITAGNCPKLSSKFWTYSNKYKRMILKNNKEK